jgi:hypothetical protein
MVDSMPTATEAKPPTKRAVKKAAPVPVAVPRPEVLIRIAFKEGDLRTIIDALDTSDPKIAPVALRLQKRMADHELAKLT